MKCKAPFNNMYFTVLGHAAPCWLTPGYISDWSEENSIRDIWFGEGYKKLREDHNNQVYNNPKCQLCKKESDEGVWPLAKAYDNFPIQEYPSLMELELSNKCNLECTMCQGLLSSGIRKNREKLPPLKQIYGDSFVRQMDEFIPHLKELRFNGGEPLSQKIVYDICERVKILNPDLVVSLATNGTVYNKNVIKLLEECNVVLNISIDSLIPERYEAIRINGKFDKLMKNYEIFNQYHIDKGKRISIMVNPMRNNWDEMVNFAKWTGKNKNTLWYNTIRYPEHLAIWNLPSKEIKNIIDTLNGELLDIKIGSTNYETVNHLINNQFSNWLLDRLVDEDVT